MWKFGLHGMLVVLGFFFVGCANMPTPTEELAIPVFSSEEYERLSCEELGAERVRLANLESQLLSMHEKRLDSSRGHALFYGWGRGDGLETVELVRFRGEMSAVERAKKSLGCGN